MQNCQLILSCHVMHTPLMLWHYSMQYEVPSHLKAEVSKVDCSSKAKSFNIHYFASPIGTVQVHCTPLNPFCNLQLYLRAGHSIDRDLYVEPYIQRPDTQGLYRQRSIYMYICICIGALYIGALYLQRRSSIYICIYRGPKYRSPYMGPYIETL